MMNTGPADGEARAMLLAWRQGVDAVARSQTDQLHARVGEPPDESNWFADYVDGVQERWPRFLDHVARTADGVGEAVGDYFEGVAERWHQLVGGEAAAIPDDDVGTG